MANAASVCLGGSRRPLLTCCEQVCVKCRIPATQGGEGVIRDPPPYRLLPSSSQRVATRSPAVLMPLGDGVWIAMIRDGLSTLLEARSLFVLDYRNIAPFIFPFSHLAIWHYLAPIVLPVRYNSLPQSLRCLLSSFYSLRSKHFSFPSSRTLYLTQY